MNFTMMGFPLPTMKVTSSDSPQAIPASIRQLAGKEANAVFITVEDYPIRYTVGGVNPDQSTGFGHIIPAGGSIYLRNTEQIKTFRFVNHTNLQNAVLHMTCEFL